MSTKFSESHYALLSAASRRQDLIVELPKGAKESAARRQLTRLLAAGLVKEIKAKAGVAVWREDEKTKQAFALRLTAAGVKAIASRDEGLAGSDRKRPASNAKKREQATPTDEDVLPNEAIKSDRTATAGDRSSAPRGGTKIAKVLALLGRESGAHLRELIDATGWLPHTTRAALTGLRKRGYVVIRDRSECDAESTYRVESTSPSPAAADASHDETTSLSEHKAHLAETKGRSRARDAA